MAVSVLAYWVKVWLSVPCDVDPVVRLAVEGRVWTVALGRLERLVVWSAWPSGALGLELES